MADPDLLDLIARATTADGVPPLNEAAVFALDDPGRLRQEFVRHEGVVIGYAHTDEDTGCCVVCPAHRQRGVGTELLHRFDDLEVLHVWAHGDLPGARPLGAKVGLAPTRTLLRLELDMRDPVSVGDLPDKVALRTYRPGDDDAEFLALNSRIFSHHPEQGKMSQADLDQRIRAEWFDPEGFFLAERDEELIGFHWTKTHTDPPVGEVYIVGVDAAAQGLGLGKVLTARGLRHLQDRGFERVDLYVEGDNARALGIYRDLGFTEAMRDVQYTRA